MLTDVCCLPRKHYLLQNSPYKSKSAFCKGRMLFLAFYVQMCFCIHMEIKNFWFQEAFLGPSSTWCHVGCPSFAGTAAVGRPCHTPGLCQGLLPISQPAHLPPGRVQLWPSWQNNCVLNGLIAFQQHSRSCLLCACFTAVWISLTLELPLRFIFTQQTVQILPEESRTSPAAAVRSLNQSVLTLVELQRSQAALQVS